MEGHIKIRWENFGHDLQHFNEMRIEIKLSSVLGEKCFSWNNPNLKALRIFNLFKILLFDGTDFISCVS